MERNLKTDQNVKMEVILKQLLVNGPGWIVYKCYKIMATSELKKMFIYIYIYKLSLKTYWSQFWIKVNW